MDITFLIGNGFDIGIGLRTRYEDFYQKYCCINANDSENIKAFKEMLKHREDDKNKKIIDWADFELAFGKHSEDFLIEEKDKYLERFEDFVSAFNAYLEEEENNINYSEEVGLMMKNAVTTYFYIREADKIAMQGLYNRYNDKRRYNFISFNYTRSVDNCVKLLADELKKDNNRLVGSIEHIHGYIDANMIMGVNDPTQITNPDFANDVDVVEELVKPQQNSDARTGYENKVASLINNSHVICIYGMSIGATDKKWWNLISRWLAGNSVRKLVILKYVKKYNPRFTYLQRKITNSIINDFLLYSDLPENKKEEIKKNIYIGANHNVFEMNLRRKETDDEI